MTSMSDSDEDLLALAGADSDTEDELPIKRKHSVSEDEQPAEGQLEAVPYPLENRFTSEQDRAEILALPEIERESILYDRSQEMQRYEERRYLAQRRQHEALQTQPARASKRTRTLGPSSASSSLKELQKRRQVREQRELRDASDSDSDKDEASDEDGRSEASRDDRSDVEWATDETEEALRCSDLNKIRFGKTQLAKFCLYPQFASAVSGCYLRVNVGFNQHKQQNVYRVCQVKDLKAGRPYTFCNRTTDERLVVALGDSERTIEMGICSDGAISPEEFDYYKHTLEQAGLTLPSRRRLEHKFGEVTELRRTPLTAEEIEEMVARQKRLRGSSGVDSVMERAMLSEQIVVAQEASDAAKVAKLQEQLSALDKPRVAAPRTSQGSLDALAKVNQRNRTSNLSQIRKAEVKATAERRKMGNVMKADPFSRLRTTARMFYTSNDTITVAEPHKEEVAAEVEVRLSALDQLIARLDIPLHIKI